QGSSLGETQSCSTNQSGPRTRQNRFDAAPGPLFCASANGVSLLRPGTRSTPFAHVFAGPATGRRKVCDYSGTMRRASTPCCVAEPNGDRHVIHLRRIVLLK